MYIFHINLIFCVSIFCRISYYMYFKMDKHESTKIKHKFMNKPGFLSFPPKLVSIILKYNLVKKLNFLFQVLLNCLKESELAEYKYFNFSPK